MSGNDALSLDGSPHSAEALREAVTAALPEAEVRDATEVEAGKNTVYVVTVAEGRLGAIDATDGTEATGATHATDATEEANATDEGDENRELVLKVGDHHFAAGCRAEPSLLELVADRTEIPVPAVVGRGTLDGDPYFLAERVSGLNPACDPERLDPETFEQVCVEAGHNLGALHDAFPADGWGLLGVEPGADELHFEREFDDWPTYFETWLTHNVERLEDTRFADLVPALEARAGELADELRDLGPFDPVITHGDYRLGNLLVEPENASVTDDSMVDAPVTNAVLDWATPVAATPEYELAVTEAILLDWPAFDDDRQCRLRQLFYEGYRRTNDLQRDDGFEARRRLYGFGARLRLMVNLREEMAGRPEAAVDARAREHRSVLREYGVE